MYLSLEKREFQHLVMQYILLNLQQYEDRNETVNEETGNPEWKDEDPIWEHFIGFIKRRNVQNQLQQKWPRFEGRIKIYGRELSQRIIDIEQGTETHSEEKVKVAL